MNNLFSCFSKGKLLYRIRYNVWEKHLTLSEKDVFPKQQILLRRLLKSAIRDCSFYRNCASRLDPADLRSFPIMDKRIITEHFDEIRSDRIAHYLYGDSYTGGSTGEPFHLLMSSPYDADFQNKKWRIYGYKDGERVLAMDGAKINDIDVNGGGGGLQPLYRIWGYSLWKRKTFLSLSYTK